MRKENNDRGRRGTDNGRDRKTSFRSNAGAGNGSKPVKSRASSKTQAQSGKPKPGKSQQAKPQTAKPQSVSKAKGPAEKSCSIISLGCPKNLVDSESMLGVLTARGFDFQPDAGQVELVIVNTCGFLKSARDEAYRCVAELVDMKKKRMLRYLVVTGCAVSAERKTTLIERFPEVDVWLGPFDEEELSAAVDRLYAKPGKSAEVGEAAEVGKPVESVEAVKPVESVKPVEAGAGASPSKFASLPIYLACPRDRMTFHDEKRTLLTAPHVAYLKIADGCDRFCAYCLIPTIRGRFVSKSKQALVEEAKRLAASGVRELVLVAQETTFWGHELEPKETLDVLLVTLRELGLFDWIRFLYTHPRGLTDELLAVLGTESAKVCGSGKSRILPYIDVPLQHCNDGILKAMNRRMGKTETEELLERLRAQVPGLVLRTSMIVGFPGETDEVFAELVEFMTKWRFERAGIFPFSPEEGTSAATMADQVPEEVRVRRYKKLYAKQERVSHNFSRSLVGRALPVMIDACATDESGKRMPGVFLGRAWADAPDIDPIVYVTGERLTPGTLVDCEMVDVSGLDLIAVPALEDANAAKPSSNRQGERRSWTKRKS